MNRCTACRRKLTREPTWIGGSAFGPTCARAITGVKPRRSRKVRRSDPNQLELLEGQT